jgi:D-psicose/D-tagatose/L-ribulose 3-epimerase
MKLAVSSIAWTNDEEAAVAEKLRELGMKYVELAPTKRWENPTNASQAEADEYRNFWQSYGIEIIAFQSMLFSRPDLKIFEDEENRAKTLEYLKRFIGLAGKMGAGIMVFGSPKNRQRSEMLQHEANEVAKAFFATLGKRAQEENVKFCIEPNPTEYACDFVTNAQQGIDFVNLVSNPGFGLHLDIAGMTLAGDDIVKSITDASGVLQHFHISSPFLEQVEDRADVRHREAAKTLRDINYQNYVSIEMRPGEIGENVARVEKAVRFAQEIYGD